MAKRLTDTCIWSENWFRRLSGPAKLLLHYLYAHCDFIGFIEIDLNLVSADLGLAITQEHLSELELGARLQQQKDSRFFVRHFIPTQYGAALSELSRPHMRVLAAIKEHGLTLAPDGGYSLGA